MEKEKSHNLIDNLYKYVQTNIEIVKLDVQEQLESFIKKMVMLLVMLLFAASAIFFVLITLALFLNEKLNSHYLGFLIVTFVFIIGAIASYILWKKATDLDINNNKN